MGGGGFGQASGCAARRQGMGIGCAPLPGRWGDAGGALSPKAPRKMRTERTRSLPGGGGPDGPRRRVAAVGRDGISLSIPRADGLGKKWTERTRSLRANMKLKRLTGERPSTVQAWHRVAEGNCVAVRRGGEQPEANLSSQSSQTRRLNPIRPVGVASLLRRGEALALSLPEAITKDDHTIAKDSEGGWDEKAGKAEQLSVEILPGATESGKEVKAFVWVSTRTGRTAGFGTSGTAAQGRANLDRGRGHQGLLRQHPSGPADGPDPATDHRWEAVGPDRGVPATGSDGEWARLATDDERHSAGRGLESVTGQHIFSLQESWHQTQSFQRTLHISGVAKRSSLDVSVSGTCHSKSHRLFRVALSWLI